LTLFLNGQLKSSEFIKYPLSLSKFMPWRKHNFAYIEYHYAR